MKKCPTCDKSFEDNLRFCQTDGTPLVDAAEEPVDPYKTIVASRDELTPPPEDPFKTIVAGMPPAIGSEPSKEEGGDVLELAESPEVEPVDPLKTIVAADIKTLTEEEAPVTDEAAIEVDTPPPSPFSQPPAAEEPELPPADKVQSSDISAAAPEPPKFSEPKMTPPSFEDPKSHADEASNESASDAAQSDSDAVPPAEPSAESEIYRSSDEELRGSASFGNAENTPIPSPFDNSLGPGYQAPSTPMPAYAEPDPPPDPFSPQQAGDESRQGLEWSPPTPPAFGWQDQQIGQSTPFGTPQGNGTGVNQTMAIVSLVLGIVAVIFCLGFVAGIPALITGYLARKKASESPEIFGGSTMAMVGMVLGGIGTVLSLLISAIWIALAVMANI